MLRGLDRLETDEGDLHGEEGAQGVDGAVRDVDAMRETAWLKQTITNQTTRCVQTRFGTLKDSSFDISWRINEKSRGGLLYMCCMSTTDEPQNVGRNEIYKLSQTGPFTFPERLTAEKQNL